MIKSLTSKWSAYKSGAAIAFLFMLALYLFDTTIGMSDSYIMISDYCKKSIPNVREFPPFDWHTGFLAGIFLGALIAAFMAANGGSASCLKILGRKELSVLLAFQSCRGLSADSL